MSLRLFADHCVPTSAITRIGSEGHNVLRLSDVMARNSPDELVIARAQSLGRILLSLNGDFSDIVAYPPSRYLGIISLQLHNHPEVIPRVIDRLLAYLTAHAEPSHYAGRLLLVEPHRIRIRS